MQLVLYEVTLAHFANHFPAAGQGSYLQNGQQYCIILVDFVFFANHFPAVQKLLAIIMLPYIFGDREGGGSHFLK